MQGTYFTSQHLEEEGAINYPMESYVHSNKKVKMTQHTQTQNCTYKHTNPLSSTGVISTCIHIYISLEMLD